MQFLILRTLTHSELGMFHEYRRQGKEGSKQRAINFDWDVVDRVFPAAADTDRIEMMLRYDTDEGVATKRHWLMRQAKNWRLEGNCPQDACYSFVDPGCLFVMEIDAGLSPAPGSWAVFPGAGALCRAILADGESSALTRSAMIALHEGEGTRVRRLLAEARPDLFTAPEETMPDNRTPPALADGGVKLPPDPSRLVTILGSVGHTLSSAVADIVDNSISANATQIDITFGRPDAGHGRWLAIADNGDGMDESQLTEAMRIGSDAAYDPISLGKYGYGLNGASWSQTRVFTVVTRTAGGPSRHLTWDTGRMADWTATSEPLEDWETDATSITEHGTVVLWKDMRPPHTMPAARGVSPYAAEVMDLERHLALVFHRFLEGRAAGRKRVVIRINGNPVEPNSPVGHPLTSHYDLKTIQVPTDRENARVQVQAFLLPSEDELAAYHQAGGNEAIRRATDLIGMYGRRNETQGLFIYRNDRLIKWGGWHQMWATNDEKTKLARVVVNFDPKLDDAFNINISKQIVHLPQYLQEEIKKLADVARKDSQKKYRNPRRPAAGGPIGAMPRASVSEGEPPRPFTPAPVGGSTSMPISPTPPLAPRVTVRPVTTSKFVWKVSPGLTGGIDLQVSDVNPSLSALVALIAQDPQVTAHLIEFLDGLDRLDVQAAMLDAQDD